MKCGREGSMSLLCIMDLSGLPNVCIVGIEVEGFIAILYTWLYNTLTAASIVINVNVGICQALGETFLTAAGVGVSISTTEYS